MLVFGRAVDGVVGEGLNSSEGSMRKGRDRKERRGGGLEAQVMVEEEKKSDLFGGPDELDQRRSIRAWPVFR